MTAATDPATASHKPNKPLEDRVGPRHAGGTHKTLTKQHGHKAPSGSGGHKYEWKDQTNDGTTSPASVALDAGDPMYSSGGEEEGNYVLVSGEAPPLQVPHKSYSAEHGCVLVGPRYTLAEFKRRLSEAIDELYSSEDVEECVRTLLEVQCPEFSFEIVKKVISKSLDRRAKECELASRLLSASTPRLLSERDVARGFERLFEAVDDLTVDAPAAPRIVCDFLVRCVVDEVLPPKYLGDRVFAALGGDVVTRARRLLSREHALSKLERIWGPGDGRDVSELKQAVDDLVGEYLTSHDLAEATKCVRELAAPAFGHEVVKRAVTAALPQEAANQYAVEALLKRLVLDETVSQTQAARGFARLNQALPDLTCDVPSAAAVLSAFEKAAKRDGVLA
jgi:programmed cell death protein 4